MRAMVFPSNQSKPSGTTSIPITSKTHSPSSKRRVKEADNAGFYGKVFTPLTWLCSLSLLKSAFSLGRCANQPIVMNHGRRNSLLFALSIQCLSDQAQADRG